MGSGFKGYSSVLIANFCTDEASLKQTLLVRNTLYHGQKFKVINVSLNRPQSNGLLHGLFQVSISKVSVST